MFPHRHLSSMAFDIEQDDQSPTISTPSNCYSCTCTYNFQSYCCQHLSLDEQQDVELWTAELDLSDYDFDEGHAAVSFDINPFVG
jgi:hypothetical protein